MTGPVLRPATFDDVEAIARLWHDGWRDGHLGHVPPELVEARTDESFRVRSEARIAELTVAVVEAAASRISRHPSSRNTKVVTSAAYTQATAAASVGEKIPP